jgi:hypothetical protein
MVLYYGSPRKIIHPEYFFLSLKVKIVSLKKEDI